MGTRIVTMVSIDTEEDNWEPARSDITVENIRELPRLERVFERLGVRATYFTSYQVAITPWAAEILGCIAGTGRGEVGGHLHPWNTPPLEEPFIPRNTMTKNLGATLQAAKIRCLTETIEQKIGTRPTSFRTGRWGFGAGTAAALLASGYQVDSSVTPFLSWERYDDGPSHVGAPLDVYRLGVQGDVRVPVPGGALVEVPISSAYSRLPWTFWDPVYRSLAASPLRPLRLVGIAARLGVVKRIVLSPEVESVADMLTLARRIIESGTKHLHLTFHSSSLRAGLTPFAAAAQDVERLYQRLESLLERLAGSVELRFATVQEAASELAPPWP